MGLNLKLATTKRLLLLIVTGLFLLSATPSDAQVIFHKKKKVNKSTSAENNAQPDKVLYDKAFDDIKHGRQEVGRLNMQTLINTYPDSEYLAKAKLAIADSFFKEGGTANLTQAVQGYKDFIVFFPFLPEAAYAQIQVAMAHYRQLEKPDRDRTQARAAEEEFQTFLQKYPKDPLTPVAEQHLREVQEILAEGDFRIGYFYYIKGDKRAAESRLKTVANRYPLFSKADRTLWMLGNIWESGEKKEMAVPYYARIVRNYPLSPLVPDAKSRLKAIGAPIPQADPQAVAWMTAEQNAPHPHSSLATRPLALVKSGPSKEMAVASRVGAPNLTPESEGDAGTETLTGGQTRIAGGGAVTGIVATVTPGVPSASTGTAENVAPPADEAAAAAGATTNTPAATDSNAPAATSDSTNGAVSGTTDSGQKTDSAQTQDSSQTNSSDNNKKESTSKKKKGLRKIVPW